MMTKPFVIRSNVSQVPETNLKAFTNQQLPDLGTFSTLKQTIFSGGLNAVVGVTRSVSLKKKTHITFFTWSIKGSPNNIVEIQLYATINGITKPIIRHKMPLFPWGIGQLANQEEYQDRVYNWIPAIVLEPVTAADTLTVKCDGSSDGDFCLVFFEEAI